MYTLFSPTQLRRRFAFCVSLTLAGLLLSTPSRAHAQLPARIKAPELDGAVGSIGSDKPIKLKDLRGKIVVLEFWTLC
jgi:hypothetical protein